MTDAPLLDEVPDTDDQLDTDPDASSDEAPILAPEGSPVGDEATADHFAGEDFGL